MTELHLQLYLERDFVNFSNFLITPIFIEHFRWLLLELIQPVSNSMELHAFFISNTRLGKKTTKSNP